MLCVDMSEIGYIEKIGDLELFHTGKKKVEKVSDPFWEYHFNHPELDHMVSPKTRAALKLCRKRQGYYQNASAEEIYHTENNLS